MICEGFVCIGILNVVASTFVVNALQTENEIEEQLAVSPELQSRNLLLVNRLDKLLRSLTHPNRKHITPKDRNVAKVAQMIHENYPNAAAKMPEACKTLYEFADDIQTAQQTHANAMTQYESDEVVACRELYALPAAKMYLVDGVNQLMTNSNSTFSASLGLLDAPAGAVEVLLVQESTEVEDLREEAKEVQQYVANKISATSRTQPLEKMPTASFALSRGLQMGWSGMGGGLNRLGTFEKQESTGNNGKQFFCNELVDPGPKQMDRIREKVEIEYAGRWERNLDYSRLSLVYNGVSTLMQALKAFLSCSAPNDGMEVVCMKNRFAAPSRLGWRDVVLLLKVEVPSSGRHHIMELQLSLRGFADVRDETHSFYKKIRAVLPEDAVSVVIDHLTNNTTLDLNITKSEWLECLKNAEVDAILNELRIPCVIRQDAIDIADADGSGVVSTAELKEGLLLCCGDLAMSGGIVDCRLKVREIQQWLRNKIEPKLHIIQNMLVHIDQQRKEWEESTKRYKASNGPKKKLTASSLASSLASSARTSANLASDQEHNPSFLPSLPESLPQSSKINVCQGAVSKNGAFSPATNDGEDNDVGTFIKVNSDDDDAEIEEMQLTLTSEIEMHGVMTVRDSE